MFGLVAPGATGSPAARCPCRPRPERRAPRRRSRCRGRRRCPVVSAASAAARRTCDADPISAIRAPLLLILAALDCVRRPLEVHSKIRTNGQDIHSAVVRRRVRRRVRRSDRRPRARRVRRAVPEWRAFLKAGPRPRRGAPRIFSEGGSDAARYSGRVGSRPPSPRNLHVAAAASPRLFLETRRPRAADVRRRDGRSEARFARGLIRGVPRGLDRRAERRAVRGSVGGRRRGRVGRTVPATATNLGRTSC